MIDIFQNNPAIKAAAQKIWDYAHLHQTLEKSDLVMGLGGHDFLTAEHCAHLYLKNFAPYILFSGNLGKITQHLFSEPEAQLFAKRAIELGVPAEKILIEDQSKNTGENIRFSYALLQKYNMDPKKVILVTGPVAQRRAFATFKKQWPNPNTQIIASSAPISFDDYLKRYGTIYPTITQKVIIEHMLGDFLRIKTYPEKGFQIPQEIPDDVWEACQTLINNGFEAS